MSDEIREKAEKEKSKASEKSVEERQAEPIAPLGGSVVTRSQIASDVFCSIKNSVVFRCWFMLCWLREVEKVFAVKQRDSGYSRDKVFCNNTITIAIGLYAL